MSQPGTCPRCNTLAQLYQNTLGIDMCLDCVNEHHDSKPMYYEVFHGVMVWRDGNLPPITVSHRLVGELVSSSPIYFRRLFCAPGRPHHRLYSD